MVDTFDAATRSSIMARVRSKNTSPEMVLRRGLFAGGFRYKLHDRKLPGQPDMVFPKYRAVVFVHGCFWHGHSCRRSRLPATNVEYWQSKIERNQRNDALHAETLIEAGWRVLVVWECEISAKKNQAAAVDAVAAWLTAGGSRG